MKAGVRKKRKKGKERKRRRKRSTNRLLSVIHPLQKVLHLSGEGELGVLHLKIQLGQLSRLQQQTYSGGNFQAKKKKKK